MILLVDLDHTIADAKWRDDQMGNWHKYHSSSVLDEPIYETIELVKAMQRAGWQAIGFTMRPARYRLISQTWLSKVATLLLPEILMREDDEWRPSVEGKLGLLHARFPNLDQNENPIILLDDHIEVCQAIARLGITVLQVHARKGVSP